MAKVNGICDETKCAIEVVSKEEFNEIIPKKADIGHTHDDRYYSKDDAVSIKNLFNLIYPVGAIYMSTSNTNPANLFGGKWVAWGAGRVPVGVNTSDSSFNASEKTGGSKTHTLTVNEMPSHTHTHAAHSHKVLYNGTDYNGGAHLGREIYADFTVETGAVHQEIILNAAGVETSEGILQARSVTNTAYPLSTDSVTPTSSNTGGGAAHNNLQPYITCYMWKKTAN